MATQQGTVDFIVGQIAGAGAVSAKKMFGEYGLYNDGKMFAMVCDDQLFVKPTAAGRAWIGAPDEAPPYPGARPCFLVPGERWDDHAWLAELARRTTAELPLPKKKKAPAVRQRGT